MTKKTKNNDSGSRKPFDQYFSSEKLLQQAIAGLLTRMPDITGVQILQGTQELGKDLIFYIAGGFGESVLCTCVVKNTKITGDVARSQGSRTVFLQAQQAFDSPYTDGYGRDISVERVYIVSPFDLPASTISSIRGRLRERSGQVAFIGGSTLFDLFKKYWPDYLADEAEIIEQHLRQTLKGFEDDNPLLGIALNYNLGTVKINSKKVYVPQFFFKKLHSYSKGVILDRPFPWQSELEKEISFHDLSRIKMHLVRFEEALNFLEEWGVYSAKQKPYVDKDLRSHIAKFSSLLQSEWETAAQLKFGPSYQPEKARAKVSDPHILSRLLRQLDAQRIEALETLTTKLSELKNIVSSYESEGIQTLSDKLFLSSCILDYCALSAPEGLFEHKDSLRLGFPKNILDLWKGHLLIVGAPGYGKTSFCRWNALQDAENFSSGQSKIVPVYIPLHQLARRPIRSFENAFLGTLGQSALLGATAASKKAIVEGRVRLYLDGLDEIPSSAKRQQILEMARKGTRRRHNFQVIITARDHVFAPYLDWLPRISLGGFEESDIKALVAQWLGRKTEDSKKFYDQLHRIPALRNLMHTPLLATLIILVFRQTGRLPENRTRLYDVFIELLSGGWDMAKRVLRESEFGQRVKVMVLKTLAARLHERHRREFGQDEIRSAIRATMSDTKLADWERLKNEFIEDGLVVKSGTVLQFPHLSFQEFLTAKNYIGDPNPIRINSALEALLSGDGWWKEVLKFYIGLSGKPREIMSWLQSHIRENRYSTVSQAQLKDLTAAIKESFPEFPVERL